MSLTANQISRYRRDGFLVVEGVLSAAEIAELRRVTDALVEQARTVTAHTSVYDLEPSHSSAEPRVRRIKQPHTVDPVFDRTMRHPRIVAMLRDLLGPAVRWDESKLNMKSPGYGAAVEWHQDWAFYPQTNDDLCAVGIMIDDCAMENGPLLLIPGSHRGPVYDHHIDGHFAGAMDPAKCDIDFKSAVPCFGPAGSISIHHVRAVHGSAVNTSAKSRRLLLYQYCAADAWPLTKQPADWDAFKSRLLCGNPDFVAPRVTNVPVRLPLPPPKRPGSIYETQQELKNSYFGTAEAPRVDTTN